VRRFPFHVAHVLYFLGTHKSIILLDGIQDYHLSHHVAAGKKLPEALFFIINKSSVSFPPNVLEALNPLLRMWQLHPLILHYVILCSSSDATLTDTLEYKWHMWSRDISASVVTNLLEGQLHNWFRSPFRAEISPCRSAHTGPASSSVDFRTLHFGV
jgi:hypothetical protein